MTIAIDFDGTWTLAPNDWREFTLNFNAMGHRVVMATGRKAWSDDMARASIPPGMEIFYTGRELKEASLLRQGVEVDVWIDDTPGTIQGCKIIGRGDDSGL